MPRKLKTFVASLGFFDLAIAAPSMKAALEAWGAGSNLFHQGVAKEVNDPEIVAATMRNPGVILKRPVGTTGPFQEHADLPSNLPTSDRSSAEKRPRKSDKSRAAMIDTTLDRRAAVAFEKEQQRRDREQRKQEAHEAKKRKRRGLAIGKAEAALKDAEQAHEARIEALAEERRALEQREKQEQDRWEKTEERLRTALRRAGD